MPCAAIGWSRTPSTGPSTSSSTTTSPASERATAPSTWPSSDTSPSTSSEPSTTSAPSNSDAKRPAGTPTTSPQSSANSRVNPDSEPCRATATTTPRASCAHANVTVGILGIALMGSNTITGTGLSDMLSRVWWKRRPEWKNQSDALSGGSDTLRNASFRDAPSPSPRSARQAAARSSNPPAMEAAVARPPALTWAARSVSLCLDKRCRMLRAEFRHRQLVYSGAGYAVGVQRHRWRLQGIFSPRRQRSDSDATGGVFEIGFRGRPLRSP